MLPDRSLLLRVLDAGIRAPSADNRHHLKFRLQPATVQLIATDVDSWAAQPHRRMLALLSYGAVIENIALRSQQSGLALDVSLLPEPAQPELIAELRWAPSIAAADPLAEAIEARHTNRRFYRREPLPAQTLQRLADAAAAAPGAQLQWLDGGQPRARALQAIRLAETERFRRQRLHAELFGAMRFDVGWRDSIDEGLAPATLQVEPGMRQGFAMLRHWPLMRAATRLGAHRALGLRAGYLPAALAPHLGMVWARGANDQLRCLRAGQAFERVWLAAAAQGLALQPMAAATALARQTPGSGWVDAQVQARLVDLLAGLIPAGANRGAAQTADVAHPMMLFRVGRAAAPNAISGRRAVENYLD